MMIMLLLLLGGGLIERMEAEHKLAVGCTDGRTKQ